MSEDPARYFMCHIDRRFARTDHNTSNAQRRTSYMRCHLWILSSFDIYIFTRQQKERERKSEERETQAMRQIEWAVIIRTYCVFINTLCCSYVEWDSVFSFNEKEWRTSSIFHSFWLITISKQRNGFSWIRMYSIPGNYTKRHDICWTFVARTCVCMHKCKRLYVVSSALHIIYPIIYSVCILYSTHHDMGYWLTYIVCVFRL